MTQLNERLSQSRFLLGDKSDFNPESEIPALPFRFTVCDLRLYPTMIRFPIYATVFHCSKASLHSFPHIFRWLRDVYQIKIPSSKLQISDTIDIADARRSYCELFPLNPSGIVFQGPGAESMGLESPIDGFLDWRDAFYAHAEAAIKG